MKVTPNNLYREEPRVMVIGAGLSTITFSKVSLTINATLHKGGNNVSSVSGNAYGLEQHSCHRLSSALYLTLEGYSSPIAVVKHSGLKKKNPILRRRK